MSTEPKVVTLRTGAEVPEGAVKSLRMALDSLMDTYPIALYEALEVARDKNHVPFGKTGDVLRESHLLEAGGTMHGVTRDVILALLEEENYEIRFVSPYAEEAAR